LKQDPSAIKPPACAFCSVTACVAEPGAHQPPKFCITAEEPALLEEVENRYCNQDEIQKIAIAAAQTESAGYMRWTRIEDIMDFARRLQDWQQRSFSLTSSKFSAYAVKSVRSQKR
jgi:hypothetical protein